MEIVSSREAADGRISSSSTSIWEEIDAAERNLVCCKFEEASSLSRDIIHKFCNIDSTELIEEDELIDILEASGMVFVQSQRELGRTSELINELNSLFGSVAAIPGQVFLTGVCMQLSDGLSSMLKLTFEEFLQEWKYTKENDSVVPNEERSSQNLKGIVLSKEQYLDIVSVYAINLLGMKLKDVDLAVSWIEKIELPEERRQEITRKLQSLSLAKNLSSSSTSDHPSTNKTLNPVNGRETFSTTIKSLKNPNSDASKPIASGYSRFSLFSRVAKSFWWVRSVRLSCGNMTFTVPLGKVLLWCSLIFVALRIFRKKQSAIRRFTGEKVSFIKRALLDTWKLAFSVQVNPLAAIQPIPSAAAPGPR